MNINEKITTELHYKDVSLICVALSIYIEQSSKDVDSEVIQRANRIMNKLGQELYAYPLENNEEDGS